MPNFTSVAGFPLRRLTNASDSAVNVKTPPVGLERGHVTPDYNDRLRGQVTRVDIIVPQVP